MARLAIALLTPFPSLAACSTTGAQTTNTPITTGSPAPLYEPGTATPAPLAPADNTTARKVFRGGGHPLESTTIAPTVAPRLADLPYQEIVNPSRFVPGSLSVGSTSGGELLRHAMLPISGAHHRVLPNCRGRGTNFGTEELVDLLIFASAEVARKHPGPPLGICNMSRPGGGDIKWSKSHNSGRDADIAFYVLKDGKPVPAPALLRFGGDLESVGAKGYTFDLARNWALVKGLLSHDTAQVQWLFISNPLKEALLEYAAQIGEPEPMIERASAVLWQPTDSSPHNDHLHLRIYCARQDLLEGCKNGGPSWSWVDTHEDALSARVASLATGLEDPDVRMRLAVIDFMVRIEGTMGAVPLANTALFDESGDVRRQALKAIRRFRNDDPEVIAAIGEFIRRRGGGVAVDDETFTVAGPDDPRTWQGPDDKRTASQIRDAYETLATLASPRAIPLLRKALRSKRKIGAGKAAVPEPALAAAALRHTMDLRAVEPLIEALGHDNGAVRQAAALSLTRITNRDTSVRWERPIKTTKLESYVQIWRAWWKQMQGKDRDDLLLIGFRKVSPKVRSLRDVDTIDRLLPLVRRDDQYGYNADRQISRMTRRWSPREGKSPAYKHQRWKKWWRKNRSRVRRNWRR